MLCGEFGIQNTLVVNSILQFCGGVLARNIVTFYRKISRDNAFSITGENRIKLNGVLAGNFNLVAVAIVSLGQRIYILNNKYENKDSSVKI